MNNHTHQPKVSNEAVFKASGKTWSDWFSEMKSRGFLELSHKEMAARLEKEYGVAGWWAQMITVEFERASGLRKVNETKDGFEVSVSKTFPYPLHDVYGRALEWFENDSRVGMHTDVKPKKLRCDWLTDDSRIEVHFNSKGEAKTQMVVQHERLLSEGDVEVMRNFWKERLEKMVESL